MKNYMNLPSLIIKSFFLSIILIGCSNDEIPEDNLETNNISEVQLTAEMDDISVVVGDIIIATYESQESLENGRIIEQRHELPECVTITKVIEQGYREVTIDFGEEGCRVHGHLLKGKLVFSYTRNPDQKNVLITYNTFDFYFDNKLVEASKTIFKEKSNENGNPQFTRTLDLTVTWPNGVSASREGTKIREWVEGYGSGYFSDNVFEITGNWTTTFRNGNVHTKEVVIPLRREVICLFFVSGSVEMQRTNFGGVLDYGEGDCDNMATFTFNNGEVREITLN